MPSSSDQSRNPFTESMALVDGERGGSFTLTTIFYNHQTRETATVMYLRVWVGKYWWPGVTLTHTFNLPLLTDSNNPLSTLPSSICGVEKCGTADGRGPCAAHLRPNQLDGQNARLRAYSRDCRTELRSRENRETPKNIQRSSWTKFWKKKKKKKSMKCPDEAQFSIISSKNDSQGCAVCRFIFSPIPQFW